MCRFEEKVLHQLNALECNPETHSIGIAVSGGADSVSLLISLARILKSCNKNLKVITVNHNIREEEETLGDAQFVVDLCHKLKADGYKVDCTMFTIPRGKVQQVQAERKGGIEEAARYLRYEAFEDFINLYKLDFLCLAHNRNDQLETLLMRFLKGNSIEALGGIVSKRNKYIRPLINIERKEIEEYLTHNNYSWRTDSTNLIPEYERNKIRLQLIPLLNQIMPEWENSVLCASKKYELDGQVIKNLVDSVEISIDGDGFGIDAETLISIPESVGYRVLLKACNMAGESSRIPYDFLKDFIETLKRNSENHFKKTYGNIEICTKNKKVLVKKQNNTNTDLVFFDIIEESGIFEFPFGKLEVVYSEKESVLELKINDCTLTITSGLPLIVRNTRPDDTVKTADGNEKKIADIFSDWHVDAQQKELIPVFQTLEDSEQKIICIAGAFLGYKDWIVKV